MIAPLAKLMDWSANQAWTLMMPPDYMQPPRLEEALEFLNGPEFILNESQPARVEFDFGEPGTDFCFPSPRPGDCADNNMVYGRLYRCGKQWRERPVVILLHGSGDFLSYNSRFPLIARRFNQAGLNMAMLVAPYHFQRRPRQSGADGSRDCLQIAEATAQSIAEIRALTGWLLGEGCPTVALWGYSLGARYAGMAVCRDARLAAVVMASPNVRLRTCVEQWAIRPRVRRNLPIVREVCEKLNLTALNLLSAQPAIPREKILLIEGIHDLFCPKEDIEEFWQSWGQPDIWRLPHGHTGVCCGFVPGLPGRVLRWLKPRMHK
jgi:dienelactone hydrolase